MRISKAFKNLATALLVVGLIAVIANLTYFASLRSEIAPKDDKVYVEPFKQPDRACMKPDLTGAFNTPCNSLESLTSQTVADEVVEKASR